jgi:hypothetical protein
MSGWVIVHHDCELDTHSWSLIGPFDNEAEARVLIERATLYQPVDGGYAFAFPVEVVHPEMLGLDDPGEYEPEDVSA